MIPDSNTYDLIDRFLQGDLPEDHPFVQELETNSVLAQELELQRVVREAVIDQRLRSIKDEIQALRSPQNPPSFIKTPIFLGAISALVFMGTLYYFIRPSEQALPSATLKVVDVSPTHAPTTANSSIKTTEKQYSASLQATKTGKNPSFSPNLPTRNLTNPSTTGKEMLLTEAFTQKNVQDGDFTQPTTSLPTITPNAAVEIQPQTITKPVLEKESVLSEKQDAHSFVLPKHVIDNEQHVFNPQSESWKIPIEVESNGTVSILDKRGQLLYKKEFSSQEELTWLGTTTNGSPLTPGLYIYIIEHSSGQSKQGTVTLTY